MNPENFWKHLKGKDLQAQRALEECQAETRDQTRILWYPSAGMDFRDLLETHPGRRAENHWEVPANIHVHTDYRLDPDLLEKEFLRRDNRTEIRCLKRFELTWTAPWTFVVDPQLATFPDPNLREPRILLFQLEITSSLLGRFVRPLVYFFSENINFLEEVLLKQQIPVHHLVKIRDGSGFGGGRESMQVLFPFLSVLNTRYVTQDKVNPSLSPWARRFLARHQIPVHRLKLQGLQAPDTHWSELPYQTFEILQCETLEPIR